jgi:hypothetical protein
MRVGEGVNGLAAGAAERHDDQIVGMRPAGEPF